MNSWLAGAIARLTLREDVLDHQVIGSWDKLSGCCTATMTQNSTEQFQVMFLDHLNRLFTNEVHQEGPVNHVPLYSQEVFKQPAELHYPAVVLAYNHPSGNPNPPDAHIHMTCEVMDVGHKLAISAHDQLIICRSGQQSMETLELI